MAEAKSGTHPEHESTLGLANEAVSHVTHLLRGEVDLIRAEVQENLNKAMSAVGMIVGGIVFILIALNVLAAALVAGLAEFGLDAGWSALIVGAVLAVIGAILAMTGKNRLKLASLAPTRSAKNVRRDTEAVREATAHAR